MVGYILFLDLLRTFNVYLYYHVTGTILLGIIVSFVL